MGLVAMIFIFWMLSFKPTFSFSSFAFIKRLFSSSLLSAIRVVSSAYLNLLVFLPAILIPACASSSLAFCMRYSAHKLNKQGDNIHPWRTPFPIWNQSVLCPTQKPAKICTIDGNSYNTTTIRTGHGTADWFQIGKGVCQGSILSPCLFNLYAGDPTSPFWRRSTLGFLWKEWC